MFVALLTLLAQCRDNIAQRAQAPIDILRLPQSVLVRAGSARVQTLAASEVDEVERTLAALARENVGAEHAEREDRVRARRALVHECRSNRPARLRQAEQRANLECGAERYYVHVGDARAGLVVLDLMLLLVELAVPEKIIHGFIVLR